MDRQGSEQEIEIRDRAIVARLTSRLASLTLIACLGLCAVSCRKSVREVQASAERHRLQWERAADQLTRDAATLRAQASSLPPLGANANSEARERRARVVGLLDGTQSTLAELRVAMARAARGLAQMATHDPDNTNELMREESARIDDSLEQLRQQMHIVGQALERERAGPDAGA